MRRECKRITVRGVGIGGGERVTVQSMTNSDTADRAATLAQIKRLEQCGCDIVRFTVNSLDAVKNIPYYSENTSLPLVADIHFDYKLAVESAAAGINKIRINPGNIGGDDRVRKVVNACRSAGIPIRVGVNGGSLEKEILAKYGAPTAEALAESALENIKRLERFDFDDIVVSAKSSDVRVMINANRIIASRCNYPLHLGVTEAGALRGGTVKGAIGIGALLADGIGDTVRMSLSADIAAEVKAAREVLRAVGIGGGVNLISCPTCGRCRVDLIEKARSLEEKLAGIRTDRTVNVALMGCIVNGPGEASGADLGCACGDCDALLFVRGSAVGRISESEIEDVLFREAEKLAAEKV